MILRDLRKNIEDIVNQSNLSIDCIYFVFKDLMNEIENIYNQEIQKEFIEQQKKKEEESQDNDNIKEEGGGQE